MPRRPWLVSIAISTALAAALSGCADRAARPPAAPVATAPAATAPAPADTSTVSATPSDPATLAPSGTATPTAKPGPPATKPVSAASRRYAKGLGGVSHRGETLYFIIGGSYPGEAAATKALRKARPYFGDMQDYFVVQRSDNFEGMRPGWWVLIEGYKASENAKQQLEFAERAFTKPYIKQATVKTADPIPVYEDLVDGVMP